MRSANTKTILIYIALISIIAFVSTPSLVQYDHTYVGLALSALLLFTIVLIVHGLFILPAIFVLGFYKLSGTDLPEGIPTWLGTLILLLGYMMLLYASEYLHQLWAMSELFILDLTY